MASLAAFSGAARAGPEDEPSPGFYDLGVSTRTFDSPLFDSDASTSYRFFGSQSLPESGDYTAWLSGGPDATTYFGFYGADIPAGSGVAGFAAGDFLLEALHPDETTRGLLDAYALQGGSASFGQKNTTLRVFGGRSRFELDIPGRESSRPQLAGVEVQGRWRGLSLGTGFTSVRDALHRDPSRDGRRQSIFSTRAFFQAAPRLLFFGEGFAVDGGGLGHRVGTHVRFQRADLAAAVYRFDGDFPYVYPLYRPGEDGVELRGRFEPGEFAYLYGQVTYAADDAILDRRQLRGNVGLGLTFGSNRPALNIDYSRNEIVEDRFSTGRESFIGDRVAATLSQNASSYGGFTATLEHVDRSGEGTGPDRTQGQIVWRRVVGIGAFLDGSAVFQRDSDGNTGFTAESAIERTFRGPWAWLAGLGVARVNEQGLATGEGVVRLGVSRRLRGNGWYARMEIRAPFDIGLPDSRLNRQVIGIDIGNRGSWRRLDEAGSPFRAWRSRAEGGRIEGTVTVDGAGPGGLRVLVNGEPRAVTRNDGSFVARGVAAGESSVTLDLRGLEPGYQIDGDPWRSVFVPDGGSTRVAFRVRRFSFLQGAVVRCTDDGLEPVSGARLTLAGDGISRSATATHIGGFQIDRLLPGRYRLRVEPVDGDDRFFDVDLDEGLHGALIRVDCDAVSSPADRIVPVP